MDRRKNNRAPKKEAAAKKKPVTIYETGEDIELLGGLSAARRIMKEAFKTELNYIHAQQTRQDIKAQSRTGNNW